jgi:hypothetical protein
MLVCTWSLNADEWSAFYTPHSKLTVDFGAGMVGTTDNMYISVQVLIPLFSYSVTPEFWEEAIMSAMPKTQTRNGTATMTVAVRSVFI